MEGKPEYVAVSSYDVITIYNGDPEGDIYKELTGLCPTVDGYTLVDNYTYSPPSLPNTNGIHAVV